MSWSREERKSHINVLKLKALKLAIMSFTIIKKQGILIHVEMDNMVTLSYSRKIGRSRGGVKNQKLVSISKEIWDFALLSTPRVHNYYRVSTRVPEYRNTQGN